MGFEMSKIKSMETPLLDILLTDQKQIMQALAKRKKKVIEKTISASSSELLDQKVELEIKDGWSICKKKKKSKSPRLLLERDKPLDEQLEDELWCIAARMGFDELSCGRNFTIQVGGGLEPRQIDALAKDHDTVILVECTQVELPKKKNMAHLIEKIESIKSKIASSINSHYGTTPKLKIRWVIATRNIQWSDADLKKAEAAKIVVLREQEIEYYTILSEKYKKGAKYQFLAHLFSNEEIPGLKDFTVPATRGKMGGTTFYNFLIKPSELLKIAYVSHKTSRNAEAFDTYQRMLEPKRLKNIANYIDNGGQFPTNIVVNIKTSSELTFHIREKIGDSAVGTLHLPNKYATAWVIDGQHRLYGYAFSKRARKKDDKTTFPVLAYQNLPDSKEASLFVDINNEQVRVRKDLLIELYSSLKWDSEDPKDRAEALRSRIILSLDQRKTSSIYGRLKTTGKKKTNRCCLTLTNFNDGLAENGLLCEIKGAALKFGPLYCSAKSEPKETLEKAVDTLSGYLMFFAEALPDHWEAGDAPQGYLCTNLGIRALLKVLKEICKHISKKDELELDLYDSEMVLEKVRPFVQPIIEYFKKASPENLKLFKDSSKAGVNKSSLNMLKFIHDRFKDFCPEDLMKYLDSIDEEGTKEARLQLDEIQGRLFKVTIALLKKKYGEADEQWWWQGIPSKIREECLRQQNNDQGAKAKEQYLYLLDYQAIAANDWDYFKDYYSFSKDGGKSKQLEWVVKLNKVRQTTHHPEKWPATKEQVAFVKEYYAKIIEKFVLPDKTS